MRKRNFILCIFLTGAIWAKENPEATCRTQELIPRPDFTLDVKINYSQNDQGFVVTAENAEAFPIFLEFAFTQLLNLQSDTEMKFWYRLESSKIHSLAQLTVTDSQKTARFNYTFTAHLVDHRAQPKMAPLVLELPLAKGAASKIIQGYGGKFSHNDVLNAHALDFALERGTPIHAAAPGIVVASRSDVRSGGIDAAKYSGIDGAGNFVMVLQPDHRIALYAHLQCGGTVLRKGDVVHAGDLIGYSGSTGYSHPDHPHLHFVVRLPDLKNVFGFRSVPTKFRVNGKEIMLREGETYQAK